MSFLLISVNRSLFLLLVMCPLAMNSQVLRDSSARSFIREEIDLIYSMKFQEAENRFKIKCKAYPDHPVMMLIHGMIIYKKNYPLVATSSERGSFEKILRECILKCERYNIEDEAEFLLVNLCARGLLLMFYTDNNLRTDAIPLAANTYWYIRRSFYFSDSYPDFNFFTGLYDYYREAYPEAHPVYKSLVFLFPKGNRVIGLKELTLASQDSFFLKAETCFFLLSIYESFENNYSEVTILSKSLAKVYPENVQFRALYIKNLLLRKKYDEAENLMSHSLKYNNSYFHAQLSVFKGIIKEKKYNDVNKAEHYYKEGINNLIPFGAFGNEYSAFAWYGLSRLSKNNISQQKDFRKKADNLTAYRFVNFDD